jgi:hypothetical protein
MRPPSQRLAGEGAGNGVINHHKISQPVKLMAGSSLFMLRRGTPLPTPIQTLANPVIHWIPAFAGMTSWSVETRLYAIKMA